MSGRFITLEGIEGVGKSTNVAFVADWLRDRGVGVVVTREPGGTPLAERLRDALLASDGNIPPTAELLMMFAARSSHLQDVIEPALRRGDWVVCDRFTDASYAYQGAGRGLDISLIEALEDAVQGQRRPDLTLLLDAAPDDTADRRTARGTADRFEGERAEFFGRVREAYLARAAAEPARIHVIDAAMPLEQVQARIAETLAQFLEKLS